MQTDTGDDALVKLAIEARENAYARHSGFRVGAALLTTGGKVYMGCNVESGAYTPTACAERVALGSAVAAGERPGVGTFAAIAVVADSKKPTSPCGVCRQLLYELAPGLRVIMQAAPEKGNERMVMTIEELLPKGFRFEEAVDDTEVGR